MEAHYFIALALPEQIKERIAAWRTTVSGEFSFKNWVHPEDYHITLFFLGAAEERTVQKTAGKVKRSCRRSPVFTMKTGGIGYFGSYDAPKVLWADTDCPEELVFLQQDVSKSCTSLGFSEEKRAYRPHITIARKWTGSASFSDCAELVPELETMTWQVKEAVLFRTHLHQEPKYERVDTFPLSVDKGK
ncbi:RNA 2',3'-cyclic phosphodiesterase [Salibacterium sp. K-3]